MTILVFRDDFGVALAEDDMIGGVFCRGIEVDGIVLIVVLAA